jgi:rare lipoprotein A
VKRAALALVVLALSACSGAPHKATPPPVTRVEGGKAPRATTPLHSPYAPAQEDLGKRGHYTRGGLYAPEIQDSAPDGLPDVDQIPEPEVKAEPRSLYGNRSPYQVLGETYTVLDDPSRYDETGLASFYGNKFHGRRTSNLEVYDMYAFSAAHKTLPLPSFARVTNLANGRSVVVRVNDRGPFHAGRIIDLSYAAAVKLGVDRAGTARVEVKGLSPGENAVEPIGTLAMRAPPSPRAQSPVHVATGIPTAIAKPTPSAIDTLLGALPIASANASERSAQSISPNIPQPAAIGTPHTGGERFDMLQNGRTMSAAEFDAWLRARGLHVATGKPDGVTPATTVASATVATAAPMPVSVSSPSALASQTYQVASFSARDNAEHALALLTGAGIAGARVEDADSGGRKVYRLRIGPVAAGDASELIARIQGLGFGQPQRVRE